MPRPASVPGPDGPLPTTSPSGQLCGAATPRHGVTLTCRRAADHLALAHHDPDPNAYWLDDGTAYMMRSNRGDRSRISAGYLSAKLGEAGLVRSTATRRRKPAAVDFTTGFSVLQADDHHALVVHRTPTVRARRFISPDAETVTAAISAETAAYHSYMQVITNLGLHAGQVEHQEQPGRIAHLVVTKTARS
jgi:hypothetical protein